MAQVPRALRSGDDIMGRVPFFQSRNEELPAEVLEMIAYR